MTGRHYKWWVVAMLWGVCFFNYADRQTIAAIFPELEREFGFNKEQLGLIGSAFMWVYAGCAIFAGLICDRYRRKHLILGGCLFWSFVTVCTGWCAKLWQFVTVRAMEGFGETFYFPASMSLASDYHSGRTRSRALAFHQSSVYIGTILGSWLGAALAMRFGWRMAFYAFGGAGMALAVVLYWFLEEPARGESESDLSLATGHLSLAGSPSAPGTTDKGQVTSGRVEMGLGQTFGEIFHSPVVLLLMLAFAGANFVASVFLIWTPSFLKDKFGYNLAMAGLSGTVFIHLASALSVPVAGMVADRLSRRMAGGRIIVQMVGLLIGAGFVWLVGRAADRGTLIVAMIIFGLCKGFYDSGIFASVYDHIDARARGTAAGVMNTVGWGAGALGPWGVGWVAEHGGRATKIENMSAAISWGGVVYLAAAALLVAAVVLSQRSGRNRMETVQSED